MSRIVIKNANVILPDRLLGDTAVRCQDGKIADVAPSAEISAGPDDEVIDADGKYLAPGFIDLHTHGLHGHMVNNGPDDLAAICKLLPRYGVTGVLPSVRPRRKGEDEALLGALARVESQGAAILGFHLEGPFLTIVGAWPPEPSVKADPDRVRALIRAGRPYKLVFCISPEFEGVLDLVPIMAADGAPVFMTHTAATVEQTRAAIEAGVLHAMHLYDVFPCAPEADPGVRPCGAVEVILTDPRVSVDFILDGEHVDPVAVKLGLLCKGPDRICLITDANICAGLPPGRYSFMGGSEIEVAYPGGPARLTRDHPEHPGALAGSGLTLDRAMRNAVEMLGVDIPQAIRLVSANPAKVLGLGDQKGRIEKGYDADLVLLDGSLAVKQTWIAGESRYIAEDGSASS